MTGTPKTTFPFSVNEYSMRLQELLYLLNEEKELDEESREEIENELASLTLYMPLVSNSWNFPEEQERTKEERKWANEPSKKKRRKKSAEDEEIESEEEEVDAYPNNTLSKILIDNYSQLLKFSSLYFNLSLSADITRFVVDVVYALQYWEVYHLLYLIPNFDYFLKLVGFDVNQTPYGPIVKPPENYLEESMQSGLQYPFPYPFYNYSYHSFNSKSELKKFDNVKIESYQGVLINSKKRRRKVERPKSDDERAEIEYSDQRLEERYYDPSQAPRYDRPNQFEKDSRDQQFEPYAPRAEPFGQYPRPAQYDPRYGDPRIQHQRIPNQHFENQHFDTPDQRTSEFGDQPEQAQQFQFQMHVFGRGAKDQVHELPPVIQDQRIPPYGHPYNREYINDNDFRSHDGGRGFYPHDQRPMYPAPLEVSREDDAKPEFPDSSKVPTNSPPQSAPRQGTPLEAATYSLPRPRAEYASPSGSRSESKPLPGQHVFTVKSLSTEKLFLNDKPSDVSLSDGEGHSEESDSDGGAYSENDYEGKESDEEAPPQPSPDSEDQEKRYVAANVGTSVIVPERQTIPPEMVLIDETNKKNKVGVIHQCHLTDPTSLERCMKIFYGKNELLRHQEFVHATKKKIYKCIYCLRNGSKVQSYPRHDSLARHIRRKHGVTGKENKMAVNYAKENVEIIDDPAALVTKHNLLDKPLPHPQYLNSDFTVKPGYTGFLLFSSKDRKRAPPLMKGKIVDVIELPAIKNVGEESEEEEGEEEVHEQVAVSPVASTSLPKKGRPITGEPIVQTLRLTPNTTKKPQPYIPHHVLGPPPPPQGYPIQIPPQPQPNFQQLPPRLPLHPGIDYQQVPQHGYMYPLPPHQIAQRLYQSPGQGMAQMPMYQQMRPPVIHPYYKEDEYKQQQQQLVHQEQQQNYGESPDNEDVPKPNKLPSIHSLNMGGSSGSSTTNSPGLAVRQYAEKKPERR